MVDNPKEHTLKVEDDEYYSKALKLILEKNRAYTTLLQLELKIGYQRALRIMARLRADGFIRWPKGDGKDLGEIYIDKIKASKFLK